MQKSKYKLFWFFLVILGASVIFINLKFSSFIKQKYNEGKFDLINSLSFTTEQQQVDFYVGTIENLWVGPLTSVVSGMLFLSFCLLYLQKASDIKFGLAIFLYLLITKFAVLSFPPCGDALFGVLSDALWLVRNHFDFIGRLKQLTYVYGGPLVYPESIYPIFLTFLMTVSPSPQIFFLLVHLIVFIAGVCVLVTFRKVLLEFFDEKISMLGTILLLSIPIFQSMVELPNMEMVSLSFALVAVFMVIKRRFGMASVMTVLAFMIKIPAIITCIVLVVTFVLCFITEPRNKENIKNALWVFGACSIAVLVSIFRMMIFKEQADYNKLSLLAGWNSMRASFVCYLFLTITFFYLLHGGLSWIKAKRAGKNFFIFLKNNYNHVGLFVMACSWFLLYLNFSCLIYRYQFLVVPFLLFFCIYFFMCAFKKAAFRKWSMVGFIGFSFLCSHGLLFIRSQMPAYNECERSLEYRNLLKLHMKVAQEIERNFSNFTIAAPIMMAQMLTFKEAGYVKHDLDTMVYSFGATHKEIKHFEGLDKVNIMRTIWLADSNADPKHLQPYPIGPNDRIMEEIVYGRHRITLFMGGFAIEEMRKKVIIYQMMQELKKKKSK